MTKQHAFKSARRAWLAFLIEIAAFGIVHEVRAGPAINQPADDAAEVKALEKLGLAISWGDDDNIWKIECPGKPFTDADLEHVKHLNHLEILDLTGTQVTDAGLARLEGMPMLRNLTLDGTAVTDAGLVHLAKLPALKFLDLNSTVISDAGLAHLSAVNTIEGLDLNGTRVTDAGLGHIQNLPHLRFLELGGRAVGSFSVVPVRKADEPLQFHIVPHVPHPPPGAMSITDAGLARIAHMPNLEGLVLSRSLVTDKGLAELKHLTKLGHLFLDETQITDAGLEQISGMTQLTWLWAEGTQITDAGLPHLNGLKNLEMLVLDNTKITDAGLIHLQPLTKLKDLNLKGTRVTDAGIARAFPNAEWNIEYDHDPRLSDAAAEQAVIEALNKVKAGDLEGFKKVVEKTPAIVNARRPRTSMAEQSEEQFSALHYAARNSDLPMVRFLLEHHADVAVGDSMGNTPLHYAASKAIATALITAGANVNARGNCGMTPLHYACNREIAELLLAHGANVNDRANNLFAPRPAQKGQGATPLRTQAGAGRLDVVASLIEHGADVNALSSDSTPLYWAAFEGHAEVADLLIAKGAKVNGLNERDTPLQAAIRQNHPQVIKLLLKAGAALPKADEQGWTALHIAILQGDGGETIEMLLKAGAAVDARSVDDEPASYSSNMPPDQRPPVTGRRTPLHIAAEQGNLEAAVVLIAHGADIHAKTTDGETPLSLTRREEIYRFDSGVQGTEEMVKEWNEAQRKDIENRNANRKAIAERIRQTEQKSGLR